MREIKCECGSGRESRLSHFFAVSGGSNDPSSNPFPPLPPKAPRSLLEALEQHLASLEGRKLKDLSIASRYDHFDASFLQLSGRQGPDVPGSSASAGAPWQRELICTHSTQCVCFHQCVCVGQTQKWARIPNHRENMAELFLREAASV